MITEYPDTQLDTPSRNLSLNEYKLKPSYLTKAKTKLHWRGQVQNLVRICKRAQAKSDWYIELAEQHEEAADTWTELTDDERVSRRGQAVDLRVDAARLQRKATDVAREAREIAAANGDPRLPRV